MALSQGFTRVFDQETKTPYAYKGNQWITYDDVTSLQYKVRTKLMAEDDVISCQCLAR